jgi:hypothetical protein
MRAVPDLLRSSYFSFALSLLILCAVIFTTACGSAGGKTQLSGSTEVTVAMTGTANDQLSEFDLVLNTLTLTDKSGKTATLLSTPQGFEFMHLNGQLAPGFTATIPQDVYTSATATVGGAQFTCVTYVPDYGLTTDTYDYGYTPNSQVTVNLPSPITITGNSMGLVIDLQVLQSATFPSTCYEAGLPTWSITPTFNVTPATFSSTPTNPENGKVVALDGQITAVAASGDSFTLATAEGDALPDSVNINTGGNTAYQGIAGFSALTVGTFVDMDGALQPDSSISASRIAVEYPSNVDVVSGPLMYVSNAENALYTVGRDQQGTDFSDSYFIGGLAYSFDSAIFQISRQLTNLQNLPFVPSFNGSNMVAGQNLYLSSPLLTGQSNPYTELDAITLIPQTINGTVVGSAPSGSFTDYTVSLASYDLFPNLAVQPGQTTLLNNPSQVDVYVDSSTQLLNTQPLGDGGMFRFYGLVFNDNGALRMDCAQVNDGVADVQSSGARQNGTTRQVRLEHGRMQPITSVIHSQHQP